MAQTEWEIGELARAAGVSTRTLRHYDAVGLLRPSRTDDSGRRHYDRDGLLRLQRVLLLRDTGLSLQEIAAVLGGEQDAVAALQEQVVRLEAERRRVDRQLAAVRSTVRALERGEALVAEEVLDGFDHGEHEEEVTRRWGADAWRRGDRWWRALSADEQRAFQQEQDDIARGFAQAAAQARLPAGDEVQALAARQVAWLSRTNDVTRDLLLGLGEMYVTDDRFRQAYDRHGSGTATLVRDALAVYAARNL